MKLKFKDKKIKTPLPLLNKRIISYMQKNQGLGFKNVHLEMRQQSEALKEKTFSRLYESETPSPEAKPIRVKPKEKFTPLPPKYRKGKIPPVIPIKSSDDLRSKYESKAGSLIVPNELDKEKIKSYFTEEKVINNFKLVEIEEMENIVKKIAERLYPSKKKKLKKKIESKSVSREVQDRLYSPPPSQTPTNFRITKYKDLFSPHKLSPSAARAKSLLDKPIEKLSLRSKW